MNHSILRAIAPAMLFVLVGSAAQAGCREDPRSVKFSEDLTRLSSYLCAPDDEPGGTQIHAEFFQFSDEATSLVVGKVSSAGLKKVIGVPKLVENDIAKIYADLLKRFGIRRETKGDPGYVRTTFSAGPHQSSAGAGAEIEDTVSQKTVRVLTDASNRESSHPAYNDIISLQKKQIPSGMHIYYSVDCKDAGDDGGTRDGETCKDFSPDRTTIDFWRGMRASDIKNFSKDLAAFNRLLGENAPPEPMAKISQEFEMLNYVANGNWPDDFVILKGSSFQDGCIASESWIFNYLMRDIRTDVLLIQNASPKSIMIGGLIGTRSVETKLRVPASSAMTETGLLGAMSETLGPGQKLLIPVKIAFVPSSVSIPTAQFQYPKTARKLYDELGTSGYAGNAPFGEPQVNDYVYGPELNVTGVVINGKQVSLPSKKEINDANVTISSGSGSCPYLLSWETEERGWTDHGKVLHKGKGKGLEYSETSKFEGLKTRFRLEEREPEVAYIDHAELVVSLRSGETLALKPDNARLTARDGDYAKFYWGDAIEFSFGLPAGIAAEDVVESRLTLTGYYERYSSLMAAVNFSRPAGLKLAPLIATEARGTR